MIVEASRALRLPTGETLHDAWTASRTREEKSKTPVPDSELINPRIGSGSDHTVFLNHLGRPTVGLNFGGAYGVYHSMYDDHYRMTTIGDPGFVYHIAITKFWGLLALRLAGADVLPLDFEFYGATLRQFVRDLDKNSRVQSHLDLAPLNRRISEFERAGAELNAAVERDLRAGKLDPVRAARLNEKLMQVESNWLRPGGIPGRPWFEHLLYAARYTYAHLELPGLTEAAERADWKTAKEQARLLEDAIRRNTELLRAARAQWEERK
jgi:N-acetylated-alpha-linked acidic dipeptidase